MSGIKPTRTGESEGGAESAADGSAAARAVAESGKALQAVAPAINGAVEFCVDVLGIPRHALRLGGEFIAVWGDHQIERL